MDIIIPLLIVSVLIGIPTWLIVQTVNKADKTHSSNSVRSLLQKLMCLVISPTWILPIKNMINSTTNATAGTINWKTVGRSQSIRTNEGIAPNNKSIPQNDK